jgi:hypothetical protein
MVTSVGGRAAHHCLKWFEAVVLSRPPVGSVLPRVIWGGVMRPTSGWHASTVWRRIANRSLAFSRAAMAEGRPESRNSVAVGVVRQTGSTPLVASASVLLATQLYFLPCVGFTAVFTCDPLSHAKSLHQFWRSLPESVVATYPK